MTIDSDIPQIELTRQERLHLWFRRSGLSQAEVARRLGISAGAFGRWLRAERLSVRNVAMMREIGMPEDLLPLAQDVRPGRRKRQGLEESATITPPQGGNPATEEGSFA